MPTSDPNSESRTSGSQPTYFVCTGSRLAELDLSSFPGDHLWAVIELGDLVCLFQELGDQHSPPFLLPGGATRASDESFLKSRREAADRLRRYLARQHFTLCKEWSPQQADAWWVLNDLNDLLGKLQSLDRVLGGQNAELTLTLRSHGRRTEADREPTGPWGTPLPRPEAGSTSEHP